MRVSASGEDQRRTVDGQLIEVRTNMAPAERKLDVTLPGQHLVAAIAVNLQDVREAVQVCDWPLGLAIWRADTGNAPWPGLPSIGKQLTGLGPPTPQLEHQHRRLVGEQLRQPIRAAVHVPAQQEGCAPDAVGQRRAVQSKCLDARSSGPLD